MDTTLLVGLAAVLGLAVGSFLNVVIWRVPRGESLSHPAARCPRCGKPLRYRDNVPVLSWLLLRGKCRHCSATISVRYPLIEVATGLAFAATTGWIGADWVLIPLLYLAAITIALSAIDLEHHRLPDVIVLPSIIVLAVCFIGVAAESGQWATLGRAALGGLILLVSYLVMAIVYPAGMGLGDVKLAPALGLVLGWWGWGALLVGFFAAFLAGGLVSVILVIRGSHGRKSGVPFGPFMFIGTYIGLIWGNGLWNGYLDMIGG